MPSARLFAVITLNLACAAPEPPVGSTSAPLSMFGPDATPEYLNAGPSVDYELGVELWSDVDGDIDAVKFYQGNLDTGAHIAHLWRTDGTLLATAPFAGETGAGWQVAHFLPAVPVAAGSHVVASYHTTTGFSWSPRYYETQLDAPPLHTPVGAGVYGVGPSPDPVFPTHRYDLSSYWVDVDFQPSSCSDTRCVHTTDGWVRGALEGDMVAWRGLPYAAPPLGDLRWRLPQPVAPWGTVRESRLTLPCAQGGRDSHEDCLYVSIFAPASAPAGSRLPVAVFLHGGGPFGSSLQYQPQALVAEGLVVVLVEWRLNVLGQLGHPGFTAESGTSGNWGDYDIVAALKWVRRNINRFGGDRERVFIFGQSGGAWKVATMLVSDLARGTFSRAGMESQAVDPRADLTLARSEALGVELAAQLGCTGTDAQQVACLRALPVDDLVGTELAGAVLGSTIDGVLLTGETAAIIRARGAGVPLLIGSTHDEVSIDVRDATSSMTAGEYVAAITATFPNLYPQILALYPPGDDPLRTYIAVLSDRITCKVRRFATAATSAARARPVYRYFLTHGLAGNLYGAYHGIDLDLTFAHWGEASYQGAYDASFVPATVDLALAAQFRRDLAHFAAAGDPGGASAVPWPPFTPASDNFLEYGDPIAMGAGYQDAFCDLLDSRFD